MPRQPDRIPTPAGPLDPRRPVPGRIKLYLDCDTGIDDALTLVYLLAQPTVDIVGIGSVSGNVAAAVGARNTLDLLALAGRTDIPVAIGAQDPLHGEFDGGAPHVHGANGIGGVVLEPSAADPVDETAEAMLRRLAREYAGELRVLAVGPFTNLALALAAEPDLPTRIASVTVMGGTASVPGNKSPVAEANVMNDAAAAAAVFRAPWSVTMVGLDVTMATLFEEHHRAALAASDSPLSRALAEMLVVYYDYYRATFGRACSALHDPLAAGIAIGAVRATVSPVVPIDVDDTDGPGRGQTIVDLRGRFAGYPLVPGARHHAVLGVEPGFPDALLAALLP